MLSKSTDSTTLISTFAIWVPGRSPNVLRSEVLKYSALKQASGIINVYPIKQDLMRRTGLYRRAWQLGNSKFPSLKNVSVLHHRDESDCRPFATDFAFSRFLTPFLHRLEGWAVFMDCDMYFRSDPLELFEKYNDPKYAMYCVKHDHTQASEEKYKMYGNEQYLSLIHI